MSGPLLPLVAVGALALAAELRPASTSPLAQGSASRTQRVGLGLLLVAGTAGAIVWFRKAPAVRPSASPLPPLDRSLPFPPLPPPSPSSLSPYPSFRTSQNGWPAHPDPAQIGVVPFAIPLASGKALTLRLQRDVAPALIAFIQWWDRVIEPVSPADTGSFYYRPIRGYSDAHLSNHSSGTAVDLNGSRHRLGERGTVSATQASLIADKARSLGLRWGGTYRTRADEMHIEVDEPPPSRAVS